MRIAINTRFLLPDKLEGIGRFTLETVKRMVLAHPETEFFFFFDRPYDSKYIFAENVTPVVLSPPARHPFLFYIWFEWSVRRALKQYKIDVFLSTDGFLSLSTNVPTALVVHDLAYLHFPKPVTNRIHYAYYKYFMPKFIQRADHIFAVSEYTKGDIIKQFPDTAAADISITYNAVSNIFTPLAAEEVARIRERFTKGKPYFLYIGAIHPRKNVLRLLEAFEQFKADVKSDVQLVLVGRMAWQTNEIEAFHQRMKHKDEVLFLDYISHEDLPLITGAALALTYISLFEGFGIPIVEAMACNVPVLTSNVSSMPEVVGNAGITVTPTDISAIVAGMKRLAFDEALRQSCIMNAALQQKKFDWAVSAEKIYQGLVKMLAQ